MHFPDYGPATENGRDDDKDFRLYKQNRIDAVIAIVINYNCFAEFRVKYVTLSPRFCMLRGHYSSPDTLASYRTRSPCATLEPVNVGWNV